MLDPETEWSSHLRMLIAEMLSCWPRELAEVARDTRVSEQELQRYLQGAADTFPVETLCRLLGISADHQGLPASDGPKAFVAKASPVQVSELFSSLTESSELVYAFEVLPDRGTPDANFKYVLFATWAEEPSVLMIPSGSVLADNLRKFLANCEEDPRKVPTSFYSDLIAACERACQSSVQNTLEMTAFSLRQRQVLAEFDPDALG